MDGTSSPEQNKLHKETVKVSTSFVPKDIKVKKQIENRLLQNRVDDGHRQRNFLDHLKVLTLQEALGEHFDLLEQKPIEDPQLATKFLQTIFTPENGFLVNQHETLDSIQQILVKRGDDNTADLMLVLGHAQLFKDLWEFEMVKQVYLNPKLNKAFDMISASETQGYIVDLYINPKAKGPGAAESPIYKDIAIHIRGEQDHELIHQMEAHEIGHAFQSKEPLPYQILIDFADTYTLPLKPFIPNLNKKLFPELRRIRQYQEAIENNLNERNADAFSVAILRKLKDNGIRILSNQNMLNELQRRKTERVESESYKPEQ